MQSHDMVSDVGQLVGVNGPDHIHADIHLQEVPKSLQERHQRLG